MQDYQAMLLKGVCTLALLQGTWALTSPLKRLRRATTVTKGANVGLASLKPADLKIAGSAACGSYIQGYTTGVLGGALLRPGNNRDAVQAKTYLETACADGHAPACHNLAVMFRKGDDGVPADAELFDRYAKRTRALVEAAGAARGVRVA